MLWGSLCYTLNTEHLHKSQDLDGILKAVEPLERGLLLVGLGH